MDDNDRANEPFRGILFDSRGRLDGARDLLVQALHVVGKAIQAGREHPDIPPMLKLALTTTRGLCEDAAGEGGSRYRLGPGGPGGPHHGTAGHRALGQLMALTAKEPKSAQNLAGP
jgi:hypothetical protein